MLKGWCSDAKTYISNSNATWRRTLATVMKCQNGAVLAMAAHAMSAHFGVDIPALCVMSYVTMHSRGKVLKPDERRKTKQRMTGFLKCPNLDLLGERGRRRGAAPRFKHRVGTPDVPAAWRGGGGSPAPADAAARAVIRGSAQLELTRIGQGEQHSGTARTHGARDLLQHRVVVLRKH